MPVPVSVPRYSRWVDDAGWQVIQPAFFRGSPVILNKLIGHMLRKGIVKKAYDQGVGRHTQAEVYANANQDLDALSTLLEENDYFFGTEKPSLLDLWAHAFIINIISPPIDNAIKTHCLSLKNLCDHAHHLEKMLYGDSP